MTSPCPLCGGDVGRGWTIPSHAERCISCEMRRALGTPIPPRERDVPARLRYYREYNAKRKLRLRRIEPWQPNPNPRTN